MSSTWIDRFAAKAQELGLEYEIKEGEYASNQVSINIPDQRPGGGYLYVVASLSSHTHRYTHTAFRAFTAGGDLNETSLRQALGNLRLFVDFPTNPMAPCPNHVETPGQNCPTCGF